MVKLTKNQFNEIVIVAYDNDISNSFKNIGSRSNNSVRSMSSIYRSKATFLDYAKNNTFNYFMTITIDSKKVNLDDKEKIRKYILHYFNNFKTNVDPDFKYLMVAECGSLHGRLHFHGLIYTSRSKDFLKHIRNGKYRNDYIFKNVGANQFLYIDNYSIACANYCVKYFTKDNYSFKIFKNAYYCSKGLNRSQDITKEFDLNVLYAVFKFLENECLVKKIEFCSIYSCSYDRFLEILNFCLTNDKYLNYIISAMNDKYSSDFA